MSKLVIFSSLIFLDLFSKYLVKNNLTLNHILEINIFLDFVYIQNFGVSFGLLSGVVSHWLLIMIGILIVFVRQEIFLNLNYLNLQQVNILL